MSKALTVPDGRPALPADLASFFEEETNILPKVTVPTLSYEGKTWTIGLNGEKTKLMRRNQDGDEEPLSVMRVVLLDYAKRRGRAYYEGAYDPAKATLPACWSDDGVVPSANVKEPQAAKCGACPMAVKGSKVTEQGKQVTACSEHRMVVVVPAAKLDFEPLRLKLAITSDYDGQSPDHTAQDWHAFSNYIDMLRAKKVDHTAMVVTKMRFDPNTAWPKVLFSKDRWLTEDELRTVIPVVKDERVKALVSGSWTPNGIDGEKTEAPAEEPAPAPKPVEVKQAAPKPVPVKPKPKAEDDDGSGDILPGVAPKAAAALKPAVAPKPATPKKAAAAPAEAPAEDTEDALKSLLTEWA